MKRARMGPHIFPTRRTVGIYAKKWHVLITLAILLIPFSFFLFLAKVSNTTTTIIFTDVLTSLARIAVSYGIAVLVGFTLAVILYKHKSNVVLLPFFDVLQSFPTFAALPLAVLAWGANEVTIIFFLIFTMVWPIFFTIISSLKLIHREWEEAMEISGVTGWHYIRTFLIPASVPALITGSIIALGDAWEALIATEIIVGTSRGFGPFFKTFAANPKITAFGITGLLVLVFVINRLIWLPLLEHSHKLHEE